LPTPEGVDEVALGPEQPAFGARHVLSLGDPLSDPLDQVDPSAGQNVGGPTRVTRFRAVLAIERAYRGRDSLGDLLRRDRVVIATPADPAEAALEDLARRPAALRAERGGLRRVRAGLYPPG
jgi:hypothetical protein